MDEAYLVVTHRSSSSIGEFKESISQIMNKITINIRVGRVEISDYLTFSARKLN